MCHDTLRRTLHQQLLILVRVLLTTAFYLNFMKAFEHKRSGFVRVGMHGVFTTFILENNFHEWLVTSPIISFVSVVVIILCHWIHSTCYIMLYADAFTFFFRYVFIATTTCEICLILYSFTQICLEFRPVITRQLAFIFNWISVSDFRSSGTPLTVMSAWICNYLHKKCATVDVAKYIFVGIACNVGHQVMRKQTPQVTWLVRTK